MWNAKVSSEAPRGWLVAPLPEWKYTRDKWQAWANDDGKGGESLSLVRA